METYDDLVPDPGPNGEVDMANLGWRIVEPVVWAYGPRVLQLTLSFNKIEVLPDEIATLTLLRDLDLEDNLLTAIPAALCKCRRLRSLKANNNHIDRLPDNLGDLHLLEELVLNDNRMVTLPESLARCDVLHTIDLRRNLLESVPTGYGAIETLRHLRLDGNTKLASMVPEYLVDDNQQCLFLLRMFHQQQEELRNAKDRNDRLELDAMVKEEYNLRIKDEILDAEEEFQKTLKAVPHHYKRLMKCLGSCCKSCVIS